MSETRMLRTTTTIGMAPVKQIHQFAGFRIFEDERDSSGDEERLLFFVNSKGEVVQSLMISCGMSQGRGYIESLEWGK